MNRKTALITGASGGIGFELARIFAAHQFDLVLVARRTEPLEALAADLKERHGTACTILSKDLTLPDAAVAIYEEVGTRGIAVDVLVNNAGIGTHGLFADSDLRKELAVIQLNIAALVALTRFFVGEMKKRGGGRILNVGSTAAFQPGPFMVVYYASKAFVLSFSQALSYELGGSGVTVTCLCPGATATNFQKSAGMGEVPLFAFGVMDARTVAWAGYRGLEAGRRVVIPGWRHKVMAFSARFAPSSLAMWIVRKLQWNER